MGLFTHVPRQAFIDSLMDQQRNSNKTKKSGVKNSLGMMAIGSIFVVIALVLFVLVNPRNIDSSTRGLGKLIMLALLISGPLIIITAVIRLIIFAVRPTKDVVCPFCQESHHVLASVTSYICYRCYNLLLVDSTKPDSRLFIAQCPVCQSTWAASEDLGKTQCIGCGAIIQIAKSKVQIQSQSPCNTCGQPLADGTYVCLHCGTFHNDPADTGLNDTRDYSSLAGFFVKGLWALKNSSKVIDSSKDCTSGFKSLINSINLATDTKKRFANPALSALLDHMLVQYYKSQINDDDTYKYHFSSPADFTRYNDLYSEINSMHASILANTPPGSNAIADNWPSPILDLEAAGTFPCSNGQIAYHVKVRNISRIRSFMAGHGEDVDFDQAVQESLRLFLASD